MDNDHVMEIMRKLSKNAVLQVHSCVEVKLNFQCISDNIPPKMKILNTIIP